MTLRKWSRWECWRAVPVPVMKANSIALAVLILMCVQAASGAAQPVPEIEALRGPYQKNLAAIEAARQSRTEPIKRSYAAELERLQREITISGDLDGALQVKAERERLASEREPTAVERKAMAPALSAIRSRFEKEIQPVLAVLRTAEDQQKRDYLAALDTLQRRLTVQNQLEKASLVRTERETLAGTTQEKATPVPSSSAASAVPLSPSAVAGAGQLDRAFADKIAPPSATTNSPAQNSREKRAREPTKP